MTVKDTVFKLWRSCLGKLKYDSAAHAEKVARDLFKKRGVILTTYACPYCQGFHLTKQQGAA